MSHTITKQSVDPQPILVVRKTASQGPEIAKAIGDGLGAVFAFAQRHGIAIAGRPLTRYPEITPESMTLEPGVAVALPDGAAVPDDGPDGVQVCELPGGLVASTLHQGPYDTLHETYAALEKWIRSEGLRPGGPPWEVYLTDPTEVGDPADWKTEVHWPVQ